MNPHVLLFFVDGLGWGIRDASVNPCARKELSIFNRFQDEGAAPALPAGGRFKPLDACLGVDGLPQSATGQTTILTGINAPEVIGRHQSGFPYGRLRSIVRRHSILKRLREIGRRPIFLNAFGPLFFEKGPRELSRFLSATTQATLAAGLPFFTNDDVLARRAIYHDYTNRDIERRYGLTLPAFQPEEAGEIIAQQVADHDFLLYEYFLTDRAGHARDLAAAGSIIVGLEAVLTTLLERVDLQTTLVLMVSDHGNVEDLSVKTHTRNRAMSFCFGQHAGPVSSRLESLVDIAPSVFDVVSDGRQV